MWKLIMVMYFIALVGSRGALASRATAIWRTNYYIEDVGRGFALVNKLQRGPVPPSQPSQCHHGQNRLSHSDGYSSQSYVASCP
ncbi:unnamed protein product [Cochlearia groenlandica]